MVSNIEKEVISWQKSKLKSKADVLQKRSNLSGRDWTNSYQKEFAVWGQLFTSSPTKNLKGQNYG